MSRSVRSCRYYWHDKDVHVALASGKVVGCRYLVPSNNEVVYLEDS